ncbi:MAG: DUF3857 and transglutaminase domain-containing protein, partial [Proteobacteria bacterium]|nr:DUF3857 and transglutaminase domain-containing protein [Pseudomonadota bacterium]
MNSEKLITLLNSILLLFGLLFLNTGLYAEQLPSQQMDEVNRLKKQYRAEKTKTNIGAVILLKDEDVFIEKSGAMTKTIHVIGEIFDTKATSDYSQMGLHFDSFYERIELEYARTIQPDGKIINVSKDAIQIKTEPQDYDVESYSNLKLYTFSFPALKVGSCFEYKIRIRKENKIEHNWFDQFYFNMIPYNPSRHQMSRVDPVFLSKLTLTSNKLDIIYDLIQVKTKPKIKKQNATAVYTWVIKNLPSVTLEPNMPPMGDRLPAVFAGSILKWETIDHWSAIKFAGKATPSIAIQKLAENLTSKTQDQKEKIYNIVNYIHSNIKYVYAQLNRGSYEPHSSIQTLENRYGDCKDQVMLIISMLKAIGIKAYPALINPGVGRDTNWKVPHLNFSHVIVYIPGKKEDCFVDTASEILFFPFLNFSEQGRKVFVVTGDGGKIIQIPDIKPDDNKYGITKAFKYEENQFIIDVQLMISGSLAAVYKHYLTKFSPDDQKDFILNSLDYQNVKLLDFSVSHLNQINLPLKAGFKFGVEYPAKKLKESFYYEGDYVGFQLFFPEVGEFLKNEHRENDYLYKYPRTFVSEWVCHSPDQELIVKSLPDTQSIETDYFSFNKEVISKEDMVKIKSIFSLKQNRIKQTHIQLAIKEITEALDKWQWKVVFQKRS